MKNTLEFFEVVFGASMVDAMVVALNWRLTAAELAVIVEDAEPSVIVVAAEHQDLLPASSRARVVVLGPEFGPLAALAIGVVLRRGDLIKRGALALAVGFPLAMAVTAGAALLFDKTGLLTTDTLSRLDQVEFIYKVGPFSLIVAMLAGVAGVLALTSAKSASLVGVFISVTTVPAAAFASVALVEGRFDEASSSALQLVVNLAGIVVAAALGVLVARRSHRRTHLGRPLSGG